MKHVQNELARACGKVNRAAAKRQTAADVVQSEPVTNGAAHVPAQTAPSCEAQDDAVLALNGKAAPVPPVPPRPEMTNGDLRNLPDALEPLKQRRRWVLW